MTFLNNPAIKTLIPSSLGIAASIVFHLILFSTGIANFASVRADEEKQNVVPIIELTDAEQARLPNTSSSFNFSSLSTPTNPTNSITTSKITTSTNSNLASIPTPNAEVIVPDKSPSLTFYSNLDTSVNNGSLFPDAPNNYVGSGSLGNSYQGFTKTTVSPRRLNKLPNLGNTTQTITQTQNNNNNNSLFPPPPPNTVSSTSSTSATNSIPPNSVSNTIGGLQASNFKVRGEETQQNSQNLPENNDKTEAQTDIDTNNANNNDKPKSIIVSAEERLRVRQQALAKIYRQRQQSLSRDETNTTDKEANNNYLAWITESQNTKPNRMSIAGTYPQDACLRRLQGNAIYGVTIAQGKANNLKLIQSAGYPILNQQAATDIKNKTFFANLNGATQITVTFNISDQVCTGKVVTPKETIETPQVVAPTTEVKPVETPTTETKVEGESNNTIAPANN